MIKHVDCPIYYRLHREQTNYAMSFSSLPFTQEPVEAHSYQQERTHSGVMDELQRQCQTRFKSCEQNDVSRCEKVTEAILNFKVLPSKIRRNNTSAIIIIPLTAEGISDTIVDEIHRHPFVSRISYTWGTLNVFLPRYALRNRAHSIF